MADTTEQIWFRVLVAIISGFFAGVSIANVIYYQRIYNAGGGGGISKGEAYSMMAISVLILVLALVIFIWALFRLFSRETREEFVAAAKSESAGLGKGKKGRTVARVKD